MAAVPQKEEQAEDVDADATWDDEGWGEDDWLVKEDEEEEQDWWGTDGQQEGEWWAKDELDGKWETEKDWWRNDAGGWGSGGCAGATTAPRKGGGKKCAAGGDDGGPPGGGGGGATEVDEHEDEYPPWAFSKSNMANNYNRDGFRGTYTAYGFKCNGEHGGKFFTLQS